MDGYVLRVVSSDDHDTTRTGCQNLSGCHDGMYLGL